MEVVSKSLKNTEEAAKIFIEKLLPKKTGATAVGLSGNLGSGKTAFVQVCAKILGIKETLTSPTFVIIKKYSIPKSSFSNLYHIDAYRLKSGEELKKLNWEEISSDSKNLIFIEWPENVSGAIPKNAFKIAFEFIDENTRKITF